MPEQITEITNRRVGEILEIYYAVEQSYSFLTHWEQVV